MARENFDKYDTIFLRDRARMGVRSPVGSLYWKKTPGKKFTFVSSKNEDMPEVANAIPV